MNQPVDISIVIPARNEARRLPHLLHSIAETLPLTGRSWETILADNASIDETTSVAELAGITVVSAEEAGTVAAVRNAGAKHAHGRWLVFLDADVTLTPEWARACDALLARSPEGGRLVSGAEVAGAGDGSWIERLWFGVEGKDRSHINTANLIVPRSFFEELGGFDGDLRTGEDFDFSRRAVEAGGRLQPDPSLLALHPRYPATLWAFFIRELWHGAGDFQSVSTFVRSKVAILAVSWLIVTLAAIFSVGFGGPLLVLISSPLWLLLISLAAAVRRSKRSPFDLPAVTVLYKVFFVARAFSWITLFGGGHGDAWRRRSERS
jgi:glycosyltransferase involved in cell wall biosynthesis